MSAETLRAAIMYSTAFNVRTVGRCTRSEDGGGWLREDTIEPTAAHRRHWSTTQREVIHAARAEDTSPLYAGEYNDRCGWCYLGAGHTTEAHRG